MAIKVNLPHTTEFQKATEWLHDLVGNRTDPNVIWAGSGWRYELYYDNVQLIHNVWFSDHVSPDVIAQFTCTWS